MSKCVSKTACKRVFETEFTYDDGKKCRKECLLIVQKIFFKGHYVHATTKPLYSFF